MWALTQDLSLRKFINNNMITYEQFIKEGVYDPNIFKAVFMAGGPGSGKSFIAGKTTGGLGLKIINSDDAFERILKKEGLSLKMPGPETIEKDWNVPRAKAKRVTAAKKGHAIEGRLGIIIDGTGHEYGKVAKQAAILNQIGYETSMVFVNTSLEVALHRNEQRARSVKPNIVKKSWQDVQNNMGKFQQYFGPANFFIVDNNGFEEDMLDISIKLIRRAISKPVKNVIATAWIANEMEKKKRT
jgi:cytidylate kinase